MNTVLLGFIGLGSAELIVLIVFAVLIGMIPKIFYLLTLHRAIEKVSPQHQQMPPGQVWLELIPVFNLVWQFYNVNNVTKSLELELQARGIPSDIKNTASMGRAYCILVCCSIIPFVGWITSIGSLVCWIIFWVKISEHKRSL